MLSWILQKTLGFEMGWATKAALVFSAVGLCTFGIGFMLKGGAHVLDEVDDLCDIDTDNCCANDACESEEETLETPETEYISELSDSSDDFAEIDQPDQDIQDAMEHVSDVVTSVTSATEVPTTTSFSESWAPVRDEITEYLDNNPF